MSLVRSQLRRLLSAVRIVAAVDCPCVFALRAVLAHAWLAESGSLCPGPLGPFVAGAGVTAATDYAGMW